MPKVAIADTFRDWDKVLTAAAEHADTVPGLKQRLIDLADVNQRAHELEDLRERLRADRQVATQDLHAVRERGIGLAIEIRLVLKAAFGADYEGLVAFNIRPRRNRRPNRLGPTLIPPAPAKVKDPEEET